MKNSVKIYTQIPKTHNCAQAVAAGCGRPDLYDELKSCGGGKAPDKMCGALYAALLLCNESLRDSLKNKFKERLNSEKCEELKKIYQVPCTECVATAEELLNSLKQK